MPLEQVIEWRGKPAALRCDNGPEYISAELTGWAEKQKITLLHIQPGKLTQNAYIERFNRTVRHEWLDFHMLDSIEQAQNLPLSGFGFIITKGLIRPLAGSRLNI